MFLRLGELGQVERSVLPSARLRLKVILLRYVPIGLQLFAQNVYHFRPVQSGLMLVRHNITLLNLVVVH